MNISNILKSTRTVLFLTAIFFFACVLLTLPLIESANQSILHFVPRSSTVSAHAVQSNKSLVKTSSSPTVYWLQNNRLYGIVDGNVVTAMQNSGIPGWGWSNIMTVSSVASYSRGPDFISTNPSSNGLLIKRYQDAAVYVVTGGRKEYLSSEEFNRRGFNFADVIDVAQTIFDIFPTVPSPNFSISASPTSWTVAQGQSASYTVTVQNLNGFNSGISLRALNLPGNQVLPGTGFSPQTFVPPPNGPTSSTLTIITNSQTPTGNFSITIEGAGNGVIRTTTISFTVNAQANPNFAVSAAPTSRTVTQGSGANYAVTVQSQNGFVGSVGLYAINLPSGQPITGTGFAPQTVSLSPNGTATSTFTIATNGQTPTGSFTIRIEGRGNGLIKDMTVNLTVNPAGDTTPPTIGTFSVANPRKVVEGLSFTISYSDVRDAGSGLNRVELWRATEGSNGQRDDSTWREIQRKTHSGNGPVSGIFTDAPTTGGKYWYGLHVVDNVGKQRNEDAPIMAEVYREPVILVHGWNGDPGAFGQMEALLEGIPIVGKRFRVFGFDYSQSTGLFFSDPTIEMIAGRLKDCIDVLRSQKRDKNDQLVKSCNGLQVTDAEQRELRAAPKVHIIAHSMGGLVTRAYISGLARRENSTGSVPFENDIGKFITLATPHFGTVWPRISLTSNQIGQMCYTSEFIWNLHKTWMATPYWQSNQANMMAIVALDDGAVRDHPSATYVAGANILTRYVNKDHTSLGKAPCDGAAGNVGGCDGVAKVDVCHASYRLTRSFMLGENLPSSGQTSCHAPTDPKNKRDESWRASSTLNEGSVLLRVVNQNHDPVPIFSISVEPYVRDASLYPGESNGTYHIRKLPPGRYQIRAVLFPLGKYHDALRSVSITSGRTTVTGDIVANSRTLASVQEPAPTNSGLTGDSLTDPDTKDKEGSAAFINQPTVVTDKRTISNVSAASYAGNELAPGSIAAAFGSDLATASEVAGTNPLPTMLAGTTVRVRDNLGFDRLAPIFFVSPNQVNYLIPAETAAGTATVKIINGVGQSFSEDVRIVTVSPGLFAANADGNGWAAAVTLRIKPDGSQHYEQLVEFDLTENRYIPRPLDFGSANDQVFLILFGTGFRYRNSLSAVTAQIGGLDAPVLYAGPQGEFTGVDQVNLRVPRSLAGRGVVDVTLTIDGKLANKVKVSLR